MESVEGGRPGGKSRPEAGVWSPPPHLPAVSRFWGMPPPLPAPGARARPSGRHRPAAPVSPREREPERTPTPPSCYGAETMRARRAAARAFPGAPGRRSPSSSSGAGADAAARGRGSRAASPGERPDSPGPGACGARGSGLFPRSKTVAAPSRKLGEC